MFDAFLKEMTAGMELYPLIRRASQDKLDAFGEATQNSGLIHLDPYYCKANYPQGKTFVYAYMLLAYVSEMMEQNFGVSWLTSGTMDMKFIAPSHPGDSFLIRGTITNIEYEAEKLFITCNCDVINQEEKKCVVGTTKVCLPRNEGALS